MKIRVKNVSYNENIILKGECTMLKEFTKWDRRTNLEKEIDETLVVINTMKEELNKSNSKSLDEQIESLLDSMSTLDTGSDNYLNMVKALDILYKAKATVKSKLEEYSTMVKNYNDLCETRDKIKERKKDVRKAVITGSFVILQLVMVLKHEEVNVITSKAFSRIPWTKL
jgi:Zn-dependent oligopeptidase